MKDFYVRDLEPKGTVLKANKLYGRYTNRFGNIVNMLITRKCNQQCNYCGIIRNPESLLYRTVQSYKERDPIFWVNVVSTIATLNPNAFFLIYGGEPFLYQVYNVGAIVKYMNKHDIPYSIISNVSTPAIREGWLKLHRKLKEDTGIGLKGFTVSLDPLIYDENLKNFDPDRYNKSMAAYEYIKQLKDEGVQDVVAEVVVDKKTIKYLPKLLEDLEKLDIWASVSWVEPAYTDMYDFARSPTPDAYLQAIADEKTIEETVQICKQYKKVHFVDALEEIYQRVRQTKPAVVISSSGKEYEVPAYKCEPGFDNLSIEPDGQLRLCLRIKGISTQVFYIDKLTQLLWQEDAEKVDAWLQALKEAMQVDAENLCEGCLWTCKVFTEKVAREGHPERIVHDQKQVEKA